MQDRSRNSLALREINASVAHHARLLDPSTSLAIVALLATLACGESRDPPPVPSETETVPACSVDDTELGATPLRRLTRFEYGRTVAEIAGVDPAIATSLPADEKSLGFDVIADAHSISTLHASKYLEVAERVANALVLDVARLSAFAGCDPTADAACIEPFVRAFGRRVYRRALGEEEVSPLLALYSATAEPAARDGVSAVITAFFQAPQFLYRLEPAAGEAFGAALASRLSFLIVGAAPDEALLLAAERGELEREEGLLAEADRLLASPRAVEAFSRFVTEWWNVDDLTSLEKDRALFRTWTPDVPAAFAEETRRFLEAAWNEGPTLETFLTAPYTFADAKLAGFYGVDAPRGDGYGRIALDPERASGLLTQGSFLASHAKANQTSPVHRGKFVRERLFCTPPDPPPDDVVVRPPVVDPQFSTRERFAAHVAEPRCAGCHVQMDPIGFAFEHYDAAGRYRETDAGKPVDASGELTGTDMDALLDGVPSLAARLAGSEEVRNCVAKQWFRYAFGRKESSSGGDACTLETLSRALAANDGDLRAAIRATVTAELFREQRREEASP
ncbi:MAG TPA: DUF1592 domain-containing protein [Polyangiaceae bacterium]